MATRSSILAWKVPWTEKPSRLQSMGVQRVGHDCAHMHTHTHTSTLGQGHFGHHHLGTGWLRHLESRAQGCRQTSYKESSNPKVSNPGLDGWGSNHCASAQGCDWGVLRAHLANERSPDKHSGMDPWPVALSEDTAVVKDKGGTMLA